MSSPGIEIRDATVLPEMPYPGLRAFQLREWPVFFGRERMVDDVIDRIGATQFVLIHGASGSGKSSLIRAGVVAQLQREHDNRNLDWLAAVMIPGSSPMWHFACGLLEAFGKEDPSHDEIAKTRLRLNRGADGVVQILEELQFESNQRLFILVDQFEEVFRFADEGGTREASEFIGLLVDLHHRSLENVYLTLTMRSDHLGDCSRFSGLSEIVNNSQYLVPPMDEDELMDAICRPAEIFKGSVDPELARRLIRDTRHSGDQLPLIQHALCYLWELGKSNQGVESPKLDLEDYQEVGAAARALSNHADSVLAELETEFPGAGYTTERIFRALIKIDDTGRAIRRRLGRSELLEEVGGSEEELNLVIDAFAGRARSFLVVEEVESDHDPKVDISHEALIRHWEILEDESLDERGAPRGWVAREAHDGLVWQSLVATLASAENQDEIYLPKPVYESRESWREEFNPTPAWAAKHGGAFAEIGGLFERSRQRIDEETKRDQETARAKEKARFLANGITVLSLIAALVLGGLAFHVWKQRGEILSQNQELGNQKERLNDQNDMLENQKFALSRRNSELQKEQKRTEAALQAAEQAKRNAELAQARAESATNFAVRALEAQWRYAVERTGGGRVAGAVRKTLIALEFLPDQLSPNEDRRNWPLIPEIEEALKAELAQMSKAFVEERLPGFEGELAKVFSGPNQEIMALNKGGEVYDATTSELIVDLDGYAPGPTYAAFSPSGTSLALNTFSGELLIYDIEKREQKHRVKLVDYPRLLLDWAPNGKVVASGERDGSIKLWDPNTGKQIAKLDGAPRMEKITFSPDSDFLLEIGSRVKIWDLKTKEPIYEDDGDFSVSIGEWSPDGGSIALGGYGGIALMNVDSKEIEWELKRPNLPPSITLPSSITFSRDGKWLAAGFADGLVQIINSETGETFTTLNLTTVVSLDWNSPDDRLLIGNADGRGAIVAVEAFDLPTKQKLAEARSLQQYVDLAKEMVPRVLGENERSTLLLSDEIPAWYREMRKPPFDGPGRMKRAAALLEQQNPNLPEVGKLFAEAERLAPESDNLNQIKRDALIKALNQLPGGAKTPEEFSATRNEFKEFEKWVGSVAPDLSAECKTHHGKFIQTWALTLLTGANPEIEEAFKLLDEAKKIAPTQSEEIRKKSIEILQNTLGRLSESAKKVEEISSKRQTLEKMISRVTEFDSSLAADCLIYRGLFLLNSFHSLASSEKPPFESMAELMLEARRSYPENSEEFHNRQIGMLLIAALHLSKVKSANDLTLAVEKHQNLLKWASTQDFEHPDLSALFRDRQNEFILQLGRQLFLEKKEEEALDVFGRYLKANPSGREEVIVTLAEAKKRLGKSEEAFLLALELGRNTVALNNLLIELLPASTPTETLEGHTNEVDGLAFSPDGTLLASGSDDKTLRIWDLQTKKPLHILEGHSDQIVHVEFSPKGNKILTGAADKTARIWDVKAGKEILKIESDGGISGVAWHGEGKSFATASSRRVELWDAASGDKGTSMGIFSRDVCFSPDNRHLLAGQGYSRSMIWDLKDGSQSVDLEIPIEFVRSVDWSMDGSLIATGSDEGYATIFDAQNGKSVIRLKHPALIWSVEFSPDGKWLATACYGGIGRIWDVKTGALVRTLGGGKDANVIVWSPDGSRIAWGSNDGKIRIYDVSDLAIPKEADLVDRALEKITRRFTTEERKKLFLSPEIPVWYDRISEKYSIDPL